MRGGGVSRSPGWPWTHAHPASASGVNTLTRQRCFESSTWLLSTHPSHPNFLVLQLPAIHPSSLLPFPSSLISLFPLYPQLKTATNLQPATPKQGPVFGRRGRVSSLRGSTREGRPLLHRLQFWGRLERGLLHPSQPHLHFARHASQVSQYKCHYHQNHALLCARGPVCTQCDPWARRGPEDEEVKPKTLPIELPGN